MKKEYYKITMESSPCFYITTEEDIKQNFADDLKYSEVGEKYQIEKVEMDDEEFKNLPEFAGW